MDNLHTGYPQAAVPGGVAESQHQQNNPKVDRAFHLCYTAKTLAKRSRKMLHYEDAKEYKRSAAVRAHMANKHYEPTYSSQQRAAARTLADIIDLAYKGTVYINYRRQFISVKLASGALVRDRNCAAELKLLCAERGYAVVSTPQGTIFRIAR